MAAEADLYIFATTSRKEITPRTESLRDPRSREGDTSRKSTAKLRKREIVEKISVCERDFYLPIFYLHTLQFLPQSCKCDRTSKRTSISYIFSVAIIVITLVKKENFSSS